MERRAAIGDNRTIREPSEGDRPMAIAEALMTIEEFANRPDPGYPEELVRGRIIALTLPKPRHGQVCTQAVYLRRRFLDEHDLGHVLSNDTGIITARDPDTLRGADVAYYSYVRVPKGPLSKQYLAVPPDFVVEVRSPSDRWSQVLAKVADYLEAGVRVVVVLDPDPETAHLFHADQAVRVLTADDELTLPEMFEGFRVRVRRFFE